MAVDWSPQIVLLGRAAPAALLGLAIGFERKYRGKSASERSFALPALAVAAFAGPGALLLGPEGPSRVIQDVATGVGFLGARLIFRCKPSDVRGLTTAAGGPPGSAPSSNDDPPRR